MELRPGYKQTDVGIIPEEWELKSLGDLASVTAGGTPSRMNSKYWNGNIPWVTTAEVDFHTIYHAEQFITKEGLDNSATRLLRPGTLLMALYGQGKTRGKVGILGIEAATNQACAAISLKQGVSQEFMFHFLASRYDAIRNLSNTGNQENLNSFLVRSIAVSLPSEAEQRAIAAALNDVDALLEGLTRLIAKKRDLKRAAMQQLLTGEKRLPGFHGKWDMKRLSDIAEVRTGPFGSSLHERDYVREGTPIITVEHLGEFGIVHSKLPLVSESDRRRLKSYSLEIGDIVFSRVGSVDRNALIRPSEEGWLFSGRLLRVRPDKQQVFAPFLSYQFHSETFITAVHEVAVGQTMACLNTQILKGITVTIPPRSEQIAIANVLSDMDAELAALEARRDKTRALKQAMMHELLTGRTRLVVPSVTESRKDAARTGGQRANIHFKRSVLAAEVIERLHDEPTFGHVKFEKMMYLIEHLCDVDTGSTYHRDAAGPYDNRALRSIDSQLRKQKWFDAQKVDDRYRYEPMENHGKHREYFERYYGAIGTTFDTVIETFRGFTTERCEIVATLFGAWRDLLQQHDSVSDDAIVNEVLNNWHKSKKRIPEERWRKALSWMREHGFVPRNAIGA